MNMHNLLLLSSIFPKLQFSQQKCKFEAKSLMPMNICGNMMMKSPYSVQESSLRFRQCRRLQIARYCRQRMLPQILLLTLFANRSIDCLQQVQENRGTLYFQLHSKERYDGLRQSFSIDDAKSDISKHQQPLESRKRRVRFISPLLEYGYRPAVDEHISYIKASPITDESSTIRQKPILLYLPGFDGTFLSPFLQFPELHTIFDIRCMTVDIKDRSTFDELRNSIIDYVDKEIVTGQNLNNTENPINRFSTEQKSESSNVVTSFLGSILKGGSDNSAKALSCRDIYIAGESFGGIMAIEVALTLLDRNQQILSENNNKDTGNKAFIDLKGLALINPATCYDRSKLAAEGPKVAEMPKWMYPFGLLKLLPLFTDDYSLVQLIAILKGEALPSIIDNEVREAYMGRVAFSLPFVIPFMPRETLQWRLSSWLAIGCERMANRRLQELTSKYSNLRTLIVAGEDDRCLPSIAEAERLASIIPDTIVHIVEGAGHASTCGSRVDLAALFRKRFPELITDHSNAGQEKSGLASLWHRSNDLTDMNQSAARKSMKEAAASRPGIFHGMEPRYDNKTIGLSPFKYWDERYYRKLPKN